MPPNGSFTLTYVAANWNVGEYYVTNYFGINVVDPRNCAVKKAIPLDVHPFGISVSPATGYLAIAGGLDPKVVIVDPANNDKPIVATIPLYQLRQASSVSFSQDGKTLFIGVNVGQDTNLLKLAAIDTETWTVNFTSHVMDLNSILAVKAASKDSAYALTTHNKSVNGRTVSTTDIRKVNTSDGSVSLLDLDGAPIPTLTGTPTEFTVGPDGLYVPIFDGVSQSMTAVVETSTGKVIDTLPWAGYLAFPGTLPPEQQAYAYVGQSSSWTIVDLAERTKVIDSIGVSPVFDIKAWRQPDGTDLVMVLSDWNLHIYGVQPPPPPPPCELCDMAEGTPLIAPGEFFSLITAQDLGEYGEPRIGEAAFSLGGLTLEMCGQPARLYHNSGNIQGVWHIRGAVPQNLALKWDRCLALAKVNGQPAKSGWLFSVAPFAFRVFQYSPNPEDFPDERAPLFTNESISLLGDPKYGDKWVTQATPGSLVIAWGTGLGATVDTFDDWVFQPIEKAPYKTKHVPSVLVNGKPAEVVYAGRAGGSASQDQIDFILPKDTPPGEVEVRIGTRPYKLWVKENPVKPAEESPIE